MFFEGRLIGLRLFAVSCYALQVDVAGVVTYSLVIHFPDVFKIWNKTPKCILFLVTSVCLYPCFLLIL